MSQPQQFDAEEALLNSYEADIMKAQMGGYNQGGSVSAAMFAGQQKQNLVEWQLDFSKELVDIERLLRSDIITRDRDGNEQWIPNPHPEVRMFNDVGVQDMLRFIFVLVNKNKVLSNYQAEEIRMRIHLIKHELRVQIYNNFEIYGLDNEYKMNNYSMIVHTIGNLIEDAYRRAMNGEERRDLNQARMVNQNEPMMPAMNNNIYPQQQMPQRRGSKLFPWNWFRG